MPRRPAVDDSQPVAGPRLTVILAIAAIGFLLTQLLVPVIGIFAVSAALSYVASDVLLGRIVEVGRGYVKVLGRSLFSRRASGFLAFLVFVILIAPVVSVLVQFGAPAVAGRLPYPRVVVATVLSAITAMAIYADFWRLNRRKS